MDALSLFVGRLLLGAYFLQSGLTKIPGYEFVGAYMESRGVPLVAVLLPLTILMQVGCGAMLVAGVRIRENALVLAMLTLAISFGMHDFWNTYAGSDATTELRSFLKNMGLVGGFLVISASSQQPQWRLLGAKS